MALRSLNRVSVNLSLLRKLSNSSPAATNGVARRTFLAGAAAATAGAGGAGKAIAAGLSQGSLRIKKKAARNGALRSVSVFVDSEHAWTIDTSLYDGEPVLTIDESARETMLRLENARLPGTRFTVNFVARITQRLLDRKVRFEFTDTGLDPRDFTLEAPFNAWVRGEARANAAMPSGLLTAAHPLNEATRVEVEGGDLAYRADGGFEFNGSATLEVGGRKLGIAELELVPRGAEHATLEGSGAHTAISGVKAGNWSGAFEFEAQGWRSKGSLRPFERLSAELPSLAAALATLDTGQKCGLRIESQAGTRLRLKNARLATLVQPGFRTQVLAGKLDEEGAWLSFKGASIEVGPHGDEAEALLASIEGPDGTESWADVQAGIRNAAFELDGAVTRAHVAEVEPISLTEEAPGQGNPPATLRPGVLQRPPTSVATTPPAQQPGIVGRLDVQAALKFRLAPFKIDVVRREDMLALSFEFVNLSMQSGAANPTLVRTDATKPAYVVVYFPPQALAEAHFGEDKDGKPTLSANSGFSARPIASRLSGESKLVFWIPTGITSIPFSLKGDDGKGRNGLLDWAKWKPSIIATAVQSYGSPNIRIVNGFINPIDSITVKSRPSIGIRAIPPGNEGGPEAEDEGLSGALRKLTARRGPAVQGGATRPSILQRPGIGNLIREQPQVSVVGQLGRLAPNVDPTVVFKFIPKERLEPNALHTQIEMPVRVILSTHEQAGWLHDFTPPQNPPSGKFALWHTRLGHRVDPPSSGGEPTLYMFSDDGKSFYRVTPSKSEGPFFATSGSSPTVRVIDAVDYNAGSGASSGEIIAPFYQQPDKKREYPMKQSHRRQLVDAMCYRGERNDETNPFAIENLMLTPLGGYLKGEWNWREPSGWKRGGNYPSLIAWRHVSTLGRDHFMKLVEKGYLWPTGHKAVLITISERKFQTTTEGKVVAYVRIRQYVAVRDPLITLSGNEVNALGFSSLTMLTHSTPVLDVLPPQWPGSPSMQIPNQLFWLYSGGQPVMMKVRGIDHDGRTSQWSMPMMFVHVDQNVNLAKMDALKAAYDDEKKTIPSGQRRANMFGQMVAFGPGGGAKGPNNEEASGDTSYPVNNMLLTGAVTGRSPSWTVDVARWRPVMHTVNITAPAVQMMQGKPPALGAIHLPDEMFDMDALQASTEAMLFEDEDGFDAIIPDVFKQNGFNSANASKMFLQLVDKVAPQFGDTSKTGGILNPNMLIQGLSKGKGPIGGSLSDILGGKMNPKDLLDSGARLLGAVKVFDIIPNPIKIDPGGDEAPYIELLLIYDDGKAKPPTGATVSVKWKPKLQNWSLPLNPLPPPLFYVNGFKSDPAGVPFGGKTGSLILEGSITTKFKGSEKPKMKFRGAIENFRVDLISPGSFLILDFSKIEFIAEVGKPFDVNVDLDKMTFTGPLTFVQKLQDLINGDSGMNVSADPNANLPVRRSALSTADPGIDVFLDVDETGIRAGLTITVPTINVGMLAIRNITVGVKLTLPFFGPPLTARFNFCERNNTFQLSYMGVTGGGFVAMEINIDGEMMFEAAFEVGGSLSFDIGVASGGVSIMAGIYFRLENKEFMLEAYIRINGNLSVLGLIRINLEFYLSLTYYSDGNRLVGTASITIEIEILFFSISVTATVQRTLTGGKTGSVWYASNELPMADDKTVKFTEAVSQTQWVEFCEAFA